VDNIESTPLSLADLKESMTAAATGPIDIFSYSFMQLCGLAYDVDPADIPAMVRNPANVRPWGQGRWTCLWGPALDSDEANLVYVAAFYDGPTGLPVAAAVVIRGTDITDDPWGDLWEAFEDLDVALQYPLPWAGWSPARVAGGTLDALTTIQSLVSNGRTLFDFLTSFLGSPANEKPVLAITGHSLGGCLASVAAPWLKAALGARGVSVPIVPTTFAAPTAGNAAFADYLKQNFQYAPRYYNTLDMVPYGWSNLPGVQSLYDEYGLTTPLLVQAAVDTMEGLMDAGGASYAQPVDAGTLTGTFCLQLSWYQQVSTQHDHRNYIALMGGESPVCYGAPRPRNRRHAPEHREAVLGGDGRSVGEQAVDDSSPPPVG